MTLAEFVLKYDGVRITAPGGLGGQCVDLPNQLILDLYGYPHEWKNAIDWYNNADTAHFVVVANNPKDPTQLPPVGALMVWGQDSAIGTGPYGHIDVVLSAGTQNFVGFDQNWPAGAYAHHQVHSYAGILGWLIPRALLPVPVPPAPLPVPVPVPVPVPPAPLPVPPHPIQPPVVPATVPDHIASAIQQLVWWILEHFTQHP
jgi:hypothetical protein